MNSLMMRAMPATGSWLDDVADSFLAPLFSRRTFQDNVPALNVEESEKSYKISLALPGIRKEEVTLSMERDVLSMQYEDQADKESRDEDGYLHREFRHSSFRRSLRLPRDVVDAKGIKAHYKDGILIVEIPKNKEHSGRNVIPIG